MASGRPRYKALASRSYRSGPAAPLSRAKQPIKPELRPVLCPGKACCLGGKGRAIVVSFTRLEWPCATCIVVVHVNAKTLAAHGPSSLSNIEICAAAHWRAIGSSGHHEAWAASAHQWDRGHTPVPARRKSPAGCHQRVVKQKPVGTVAAHRH